MNIRICKYCLQEFDIEDKPSGWMANHTRWCDKNPKRKEYVDNLKSNGGNVTLMNAARIKSGNTNQYTKARLEGREIPESPMKGKPGTFLGKTHTEESKRKISEKALASTHRRLKKGTIEYKGIILDSSWELELAKQLDKLEIKWIRPDPISWVDGEGVTHNYFPDFYLEDYDLFLDPKNPQALKIQKKKLDILLKQYSNIIIIESLEECKNYSI